MTLTKADRPDKSVSYLAIKDPVWISGDTAFKTPSCLCFSFGKSSVRKLKICILVPGALDPRGRG